MSTLVLLKPDHLSKSPVFLPRSTPSVGGGTVSHETICGSPFVPSRGVHVKEPQKHLRTQRLSRRNMNNTVTGQPLSQIRDAVSISEQPKKVAEMGAPEHWEGERDWAQIATIVEGNNSYCLII